MTDNKPYPATTDELGVNEVLAALVVYPTVAQAKAFVEEQGYKIDRRKMEAWRDRRFPERYREIRKELAPQLEAELAEDHLTNARLASMVVRSALGRTQDMLDEDKVVDPSRVARDVQQVGTQAIDKRLALQGRPTSIVEKRSTDEIVRQLEALGVARQVDVVAQSTEED